MNVFSERKTGQSRSKLALAVFFSFSLHVFIFVAAMTLLSAVTPRVSIPPSYQVKLVGLPSELTAEPRAATAPAPAAPKPEEKPRKEPASRKAIKVSPKQSKTALKKSAMPEFSQKPKKAAPEPARPEAAPSKSAPGPPVPERAVAKAGGAAEGVAVGHTSPEFKFPPYVAIIKEKIEQNWNPPPSSKNIKVTVLFKILRSGRVEDPKLKESSGQFYFDQAAIRAILMSNPFPPLPEGFFRDYEEFSVDMMEKE